MKEKIREIFQKEWSLEKIVDDVQSLIDYNTYPVAFVNWLYKKLVKDESLEDLYNEWAKNKNI